MTERDRGRGLQTVEPSLSAWLEAARAEGKAIPTPH
jgi:hypothetical protein